MSILWWDVLPYILGIYKKEEEDWEDDKGNNKNRISNIIDIDSNKINFKEINQEKGGKT